MNGEPIYLVKQTGPVNYEIAKFVDAKWPDDLYRVRLPVRGHNHCDCNGFRRDPDPTHHKHIVLVNRFIELGKPRMAVFRMNGEISHTQPFSEFEEWEGL